MSEPRCPFDRKKWEENYERIFQKTPAPLHPDCKPADIVRDHQEGDEIGKTHTSQMME